MKLKVETTSRAWVPPIVVLIVQVLFSGGDRRLWDGRRFRVFVNIKTGAWRVAQMDHSLWGRGSIEVADLKEALPPEDVAFITACRMELQ